jgi:hypothetical protein
MKCLFLHRLRKPCVIGARFAEQYVESVFADNVHAVLLPFHVEFRDSGFSIPLALRV